MPPKTRKYCCMCSNFRGKLVDGKVVSLHRFPTNDKIRRVWIQRCRLIRTDFKLTKNTFLCSDHCAHRKGPSPLHTIPSIFATKSFQISKLDENYDLKENIPDIPDTMEMETDFLPDSQEQSYSADDDVGNLEDRSLISSESLLDVSLRMHDYIKPECLPQRTVVRNQFVQTYSERRTFGTRTEYVIPCAVDKDMQTDGNETWTRNMAVQVNLPQLTYEDISSDDSKIFFYTGIPDKNTFDALFDELKDDSTTRTARKNSNEGVSGWGRPRSLKLVDEFFLVLMRLRLGLLIEDLAQRFCISRTTCGDIFNQWVDYLDDQLSFLIQWTDRTCIDQNMPDVFRKKFPSTRVVIDCTEIRTETPSSLQLKSLMYSDYKSHMTWKSLVGISPVGVITFISDLWCGSVSDKQITNECASGILDLCEPGDGIMADKGFTIADLTTPLGVHLVIPPFRGKKAQFSKREIQKTRDIANARIHVERQMARIKNFRILQGVIPITMSQKISKVWKLCARLTNLQPPLVLDAKNTQDSYKFVVNFILYATVINPCLQ